MQEVFRSRCRKGENAGVSAVLLVPSWYTINGLFMYHPPSKQTQIWRRTAVYSAMIVAILTLVTALVFVILGYRFNGDDGKIEQGGLVQFGSQPGGAAVTIDGVAFGARTSSKTTMTAGSHYVTMQRDGYQQWNKTVQVVPGSILWLTYARLIPTELPVSNVATFSAVSSSLASPSRETIALTTDPALPELQLTDITKTEPTTAPLTLPTTLYTAPEAGKSQSFALVEWDKDSRYILVKHVIEGVERPEWLIVDTRSVEQSKNITKLFNIDATELKFSGNSSQQLYALSAGDVRKVDVNAGTISRPLASNVTEFALYRASGVTFVTAADTATKLRSVGYALDGDAEPRVLRQFPDDGQVLHVALDEYFNDTYVAIAHGGMVTIARGGAPKTAADLDKMTAVSSMKLTSSVARLSIKTDGRFVVAEQADAFAVYDLEIGRETVTPLKGATSTTSAPLQWLDGYMPWSDRDGTLRLHEFDGANQHDIMPVVSGQAVVLSRNGTYLYTIGKSSDASYHVQRVRLILP